jgi:ABC-type transport system involved in multi-copper enzyme maturation permease subunit
VLKGISHIFTIAQNTFRESIRDKILYNIIFLAVGLVAFTIILGEWSVFDRAHVIKTTTLTIMSFSGLLISVFIGISLVQKEIQKRTVLTLLSKPIYRIEFIVGKYFGLLAVITVNLALLTGIFYLILWATHSSPSLDLLQAVYLIFCEMAIVIAVALLFSSFSSPVLSALFTLGIYIAGHLSDQLLEQVRFVQRMGEIQGAESAVLERAAAIIHAVFPGLYRYNVSGYVVYQIPLPDHYLLWNSLYALGYIGIFLVVASWWFSRRDFL